MKPKVLILFRESKDGLKYMHFKSNGRLVAYFLDEDPKPQQKHLQSFYRSIS